MGYNRFTSNKIPYKGKQVDDRDKKLCVTVLTGFKLSSCEMRVSGVEPVTVLPQLFLDFIIASTTPSNSC